MPGAQDERLETRSLSRRALLTLAGTFGLYAGLTATHRGEFWPLSIFPMFSLAGRPWRRALMVELHDEATPVSWTPTTLDALPGTPVSTKSVGLSTNDMSKFVQLTEHWDTARVATLRTFWQPLLDDGAVLLLMGADGHLTDGGEVVTALTPLVVLRRSTQEVNPHLEQDGAPT
ncbi:MAG: hypothetical protein KUG77_07095 [Nannocystaceae bacterium]|nr:hypothetical protein [Nannocystaceae bacterium]